MSLLQSVSAGIVQGLTEFLPVSSSGHLVILKTVFKTGLSGMEMEVMLHLGTLFAVFLYYRNAILDILRDSFSKTSPPGFLQKDAVLIIIATVPAALAGILFKERLELLFEKADLFTYFALFITAMVLFLTSKSREAPGKSIGLTEASIIGLAQAAALIPGISRSGMTIACALFLGIGKEKAVRFSLLMMVPAVGGAVLLDAGDIARSLQDIPAVLAGVAAAFLAGLAAIRILNTAVIRLKLHLFAYYLAAAALTGMLFLAAG